MWLLGENLVFTGGFFWMGGHENKNENKKFNKNTLCFDLMQNANSKDAK